MSDVKILFSFFEKYFSKDLIGGDRIATKCHAKLKWATGWKTLLVSGNRYWSPSDQRNQEVQLGTSRNS